MSKLQIAQRKIPHFGSAATLSFSSSPPPSSARVKQLQFPSSRRLRLRILTALRSSITAFSSSVVLIGAGAPFCQLLVAAGQQDGLQYRFPREPISLCHVRSYAHKLFWGARFNELLSHTGACRFWLVFFLFFFLFYDSCSDLIYCTTTITTINTFLATIDF